MSSSKEKVECLSLIDFSFLSDVRQEFINLQIVSDQKSKATV